MVDKKTAFPQSILIAGPTGSGKSKFALSLARRRNGVIINADSMQVYHELRVLSARPSLEDEALLPHRLYGHISLKTAYSVGEWLEDISKVLAEVRAEGRLPIIVGGTGLYFRALVEGLAPVPKIPEDVRAHWREKAERMEVGDLHLLLEQRDREMAQRLEPRDRQRIVRALEVIEGTGISLAQWQRAEGEPALEPGSYLGLVVDRPREEIYRACEQRFDEMVEVGALEEAARVRDMQLDVGLPGMRALGLRPLLAYLDGDIDLDEALVRAKRDTRHYVKRQLTWLRRNMIAWKHVNSKDMESIEGNLFAFIED